MIAPAIPWNVASAVMLEPIRWVNAYDAMQRCLPKDYKELGKRTTIETAGNKVLATAIDDILLRH